MELLSAASRAHLGASAQAEILSISGEEDPRLASEAWLGFARRQEAEGRVEAAAEIYEGLLSSPAGNGARERLAVLAGGGTFGARFESLARNFVREAADPAMIAGMGAAATVSSVLRMGTLSRLLASPTASVFTRGAGARWVAASAAFIPEVGAFWGASRATRALLRPEDQAWDARTISHEWASLGLTLGLLKFGAWAANGLFHRVHGMDSLGVTAGRLPAFTRLSRPLTEQLGIFTGISLARFLEPRLGLGTARPAGSFWSDTLATMLQFHVGGRLSGAVMGPGHAARMRELEFRTRNLEMASQGSGGLSDGMAFAVTPSGFSMPVSERESSIPQNVFMMHAKESPGAEVVAPKSAPRPVSGERLLRDRLRFTRFAVESRIRDLDPEYFSPEQLGKLISKIRKGVFNPSERARLQHEVRRYLNEKNLPNFSLDHPLVVQRADLPWINGSVTTNGLSPRAQSALSEIQAAREVLAALSHAESGDYTASPFLRSEGLSEIFGGDLYYLNDASRATGSFKERGALVAVRQAALQGALHVVTASHGNHGLAVAMAAQRLGLRSTIVVPDTTPQVKLDRLRALGATVVETGEQPWRGYEEARDWAVKYTLQRNRYLERAIEAKGILRYVHGFEDVVPGQGVAAYEILDAIHAMPQPQRARFERAAFLLPTGGGGLTAGVGTVLREHLPLAKVVAVVSREAPALHFSLFEGRRSEVFLNEKSLCDSGIGLTIPGARPFELLREVLDGSLAVSDPQVGEALRLIQRHEGLTVEGSAATGIAALLSGKLGALGVSLDHPIVTIFTGRNIDASRHADVIAGREAPWNESNSGDSR